MDEITVRVGDHVEFAQWVPVQSLAVDGYHCESVNQAVAAGEVVRFVPTANGAGVSLLVKLDGEHAGRFSTSLAGALMPDHLLISPASLRSVRGVQC